VAAVAAVVSLVAVGGASADRQKVQLTAAGQALARIAAVSRADVGPGGWKGSIGKGDPTGEGLKCPGYEPKQSDLILIGSASSLWRDTNVQVSSETEVLKTPAMVVLDWQRTFGPKRAFLACIRSEVAKALGMAPQLVAMKGSLAFPKYAARVLGYRFNVVSKATNVPFLVDFVVVARGRAATTITFIAPASIGSTVLQVERSYVKRIVERLTAAGA
jgi:hypothetical protein